MGIRLWIAGSALAQGLSRGPLSTELFSGVEKPTVTVVKLLIVEMIQHPDASPRMGEYIGKGESYWHVTFPSFVLTYKHREANWASTNFPESLRFDAVTCDIKLKEEEQKLFEAPFLSWWERRKARIANKSEYDRQQAAVDFIANKLGVKETPDDRVDA